MNHALTELNAAVEQLGNARSVAFRSNDPLLNLSPDGSPGKTNYLRVIDRIERQLRHLFVESASAEALYSARYWRIHDLTLASTMPDMVIQAEIDAVKQRVEGWIDVLSSYQQLVGRPGKAVAVLDTNAFMHYRPFTEIPWCEVLENPSVASVRLVVPLIVLDELDDKGYSGNKRLAKRAGKVLGAMSEYLDAIDHKGVAHIKSGVTMEILGEDDDHQRRTNSDSEILDRAQFLGQVLDREVTVVTADRGMRARGRARNLAVRTLPNVYRLPLEDEQQ